MSSCFLPLPRRARSPASFTFYGIVLEEEGLWFVLMHVHASFFFLFFCFFPWHALNIQCRPGVKSINSFRLHEREGGFGIVYSAERSVGFFLRLQFHKWLSLRQLLKTSSFARCAQTACVWLRCCFNRIVKRIRARCGLEIWERDNTKCIEKQSLHKTVMWHKCPVH